MKIYTYTNGKVVRYTMDGVTPVYNEYEPKYGEWKSINDDPSRNMSLLKYLSEYEVWTHFHEFYDNHGYCLEAIKGDSEIRSKFRDMLFTDEWSQACKLSSVYYGKNGGIPIEIRLEDLPVYMEALKVCARSALARIMLKFHGFALPDPKELKHIFFALSVPPHETDNMINALADARINELYKWVDIQYDPLCCKEEEQWRCKALVTAHALKSLR